MAGLLTARVLSEYFDNVTLLEKDTVRDEPESRKGQPQTRHVHALLMSGFSVMRDLFPGIQEDLEAGGATVCDLANDVRFHMGGGYVVRHESGMRALFASRPFLEWKVRQRVLGIANVLLRDETRVTGLRLEAGRVTGVAVQDAQGTGQIDADLVVDATGRGSQLGKWIEEFGYSRPAESLVKIDVSYTTTVLRRPPEASPAAKAYLCNPDLPGHRHLAVMFPMEGDRWILTLGGWNGDHCPCDHDSVREWVAGLQAPEIAQVTAQVEPLTEPYRYKFAANLRRHYEKMRDFPDGLLVIGDAIASFNPVYGQGMSSTSLQVQQLREVLGHNGKLPGIWAPYFRGIAPIIDNAWQLAVGADFAFSGTSGPKPAGTNLINRYLERVFRACHRDPVVHTAFLRVQSMMASPLSLLHPRIMWRVITS